MSAPMGTGLVHNLIGMPSDHRLMQALSQLVIAHTQLELILRYTVKTLSGLSVSDALDATGEDRASGTSQ